MIKREGNCVRIRLERQFYDEDTVKESLKDFAHLCKGDIKTTKQFIDITIKAKENGNVKVIAYELCNYTLGLMKNKVRV